MGKLIVVGDLHFQSLRPWSVPVGRRVVEELNSNPLNNPNNTLVLLGDLTELAVLDGAVFSMLMSLFMGAKYKKVYILRGNHDGKVVDGKVVATFDFLKDAKSRSLFPVPIVVIEEPQALMVEGLECLFLPHLFEDGVHSLSQYEAGGVYEPLLRNTQYDVVFGHFTNTMRPEPGRKYDVSYLQATYWCFGHNHNPGPGYQGSHIPNTIAEANQNRQVRTYEWDGKVKETILPAPRILDYYTVKFPEPLPAVEAEIPVWTISECTDEAHARAQYGDIYIRRCLYDLTTDSASFDRQNMAMTTKNGETLTVEQLFTLWEKMAKMDKELEADTRAYLSLAIK